MGEKVRLTRRGFVRMGAALAAAPWLAPLSGCEPVGKLRIAVMDWCGHQFLTLAERQGYYKSAALDLRPVPTAVETSELFERGEVDGITTTFDEALRLRSLGHRLTIVLIFDFSAGADALLARAPLESLSQLRGKRIAVEDTSFGKLMLHEVLSAAALRPGDIVVVPMDENHLGAWQRDGSLDAILTYGTALQELKALGLVPLVDSSQLHRVLLDLLVVRSDAAQRHQEPLRELIAGHFRALDLWRSNPVDAAYLLAPLVHARPEQVPTVFSGLDLPDIPANREYLSPPATELNQTARLIARVLDLDEKAVRQLGDFFSADYLPP